MALFDSCLLLLADDVVFQGLMAGQFGRWAHWFSLPTVELDGMNAESDDLVTVNDPTDTEYVLSGKLSSMFDSFVPLLSRSMAPKGFSYQIDASKVSRNWLEFRANPLAIC
jgi:hypothetical protein